MEIKIFVCVHMIKFEEKKFLVVGLGVTGISMSKYLIHRNALVTVFDDQKSYEEMQQVFLCYSNVHITRQKSDQLEINTFDYVAVSPGVKIDHSILSRARKQNKIVISDIDIFFNNPSIFKSVKLVGITGSNGKTTVTEMVGGVCEKAQIDFCLLGNIGNPVLDFLKDIEIAKSNIPEVLVIELSSFQLEHMNKNFLNIAVILNVTEDHTDWHDSFSKYLQAKLKIFKNVEHKIANQNLRNVLPKTLTGLVTFGLKGYKDQWHLKNEEGKKIIYLGGRRLFDSALLRVVGIHNIENAMAAAAVCDFLSVKFDAIETGLLSFEGLPNRVALIRVFNGVNFIDDSKATNVGATVAALNNFNGTAVPILGGDGKGQDFSPLKSAVAISSRGVILIGQDKDVIAESLSGLKIPVKFASNMEDAVNLALQIGHRGDSVILSPACASFDMFKNYQERGRVFQEVTSKLIEST